MPVLSQNFKKNLLIAALIATVVTIPLKNQLNSIAFILFVIGCLVQNPLKESARKLKESSAWIFPVILFLWYACTYFWDVSGEMSIKEIERYFILLFVPPAMAIAPDYLKRYIPRACFAFVAITIAVCLICLVKSYVEYQMTDDYRVFYYHYLSEQMGLNAIFLSNYCLASITWLMYFGFILNTNRSLKRYLFYIPPGIFLLIMIFLLSSKLIILLTLLMLIIFILMAGYIRGYFFRSVLLTGIILLAGLFAVSKLSYVNWRFSETEIKMYRGQQDDQNGIAIRLYMWQTAANLIAERPVLGYGLRGARTETMKIYKEQNFELGYNGNYHSHNQYLESMMMGGIPALLLLFAMIANIILTGVRGKNFLLLLIAFHFVIQSLIEATFEVQHELVFYIFFIYLFLYHSPVLKQPQRL